MRDTGRESDKFMLRLPDGMRERIAAAAKRHGRSMNAEIVLALEDAFPPTPTLDELIDGLDAFVKMEETGVIQVRKDILERLNLLRERLAAEMRP